MKKLVLITMLIPVLAFAQSWEWDVGLGVDSLMISDYAITCDTVGAALTYADLTCWTDNWDKPKPAKHDTLKEYIVEIKEVCDTLFAKKWMPFKVIEGIQFYRQMTYIDSVVCHIDTSWANKTPVYLDPDEYEKLMEWLRD